MPSRRSCIVAPVACRRPTAKHAAVHRNFRPFFLSCKPTDSSRTHAPTPFFYVFVFLGRVLSSNLRADAVGGGQDSIEQKARGARHPGRLIGRRRPQVFPNRARKEAALAHPQVFPSLTVGVRKSEVPSPSPPGGFRRDYHAPEGESGLARKLIVRAGSGKSCIRSEGGTERLAVGRGARQ